METFVTIMLFLGMTLAFEFVDESLNTTGIEGTMADLPCAVIADQYGVGPTYSYWVRHRDGQLLPLSENADTSKYARRHGTLARRLSIISGSQFEYRLQISDLQLDDAGYYQCFHLEQNDYSHYARKSYLSVLPRLTAEWFPRCTIGRGTGPSFMGITVGSTVVFTCQAPNDLQLPSNLGIYVKDPRSRNSSVTITTCDHVPCSFAYELKLSDRNNRLTCGTRIRSNDFEEECTGSMLPERTDVNLVSEPSILSLNSRGTFFCLSADSRTNYRYQWFIGDRNLSGIRNNNEFTVFSIRGNLNNSEITCVVNDIQGYVGSRTITIHVAMVTDGKIRGSQGEELGYEDGVGGIVTDFPTGEVVSGGHSPGNKMFGIPMEVLVFFLCAILVLLLILIIIILLVCRQKTRNSHNIDNKHIHVVYQQDYSAKVRLNSDAKSASFRPLPPIGSQGSDYPEENSLYDNINEYQQERVPQAETLPYNSNNAEGIGVSPNGVGRRGNPSPSNNDYNVLDPRRASNDTMDSIDIEELHERTRDPSPMRGKSLSVSTNPSRSEGSSGRSRLASLPVGKQNTLYAVTSLIMHHNLDDITSASDNPKGALTSTDSPSSRGTESAYASPCNRPKSCDESLATGPDTGGEVSKNAADLITPESGVVVLGRARDGSQKVVKLDDRKYILDQGSSDQCVNGRM